MEDSKPVVGTVDLYTGVKLENEVAKKVHFRELAGPEEDILASGTTPVALKITKILANCTTELGSLIDPNRIREAIEKLVIIDRWHYLVELRSLSLGSTYQSITKCPECKRDDKILVDLRDLKVTNPPSAENLFHETKLPSGHLVRWHVGDGATELQIEKLIKDDNKASVGLFARCTEIDSRPVSFADIKNLTMKDRSFLRKKIDEVEGDFDDKYRTTCPGCGFQYEGEVNLEPSSFFYP